MQEEFITQYKYLEEHIQQCYPGSMIALDFSIKDILDTFSEIARSHWKYVRLLYLLKKNWFTRKNIPRYGQFLKNTYKPVII